MKIKRSKTLLNISLLFIIILALLTQFIGISKESYWLDESISVHISQRQETFFPELRQRMDHSTHLLILKVWTKLFGISELSTRSLSAILGVLAIIAMYYLGKQLFNKEHGLIAASLMAVSSLTTYYSQETRHYSLFLLMAIISFYFYIKLKHKNSDRPYLITTTILIYTHPFAIIVPIIQNVNQLLNKKFNIEWFKTQIKIGVLALPVIILSILRVFQINNHTTPEWIPKLNLEQFTEFLIELSGNKIILTIFLSIIIIWLTKNLIKKEFSKQQILISLWLFGPIIITAITSIIFRSVFITRYLIFILPALFLLIANSLQIFSNKKVRILITSIIIVLSVIALTNQYQTQDKDDFRGTSKYLKQELNNTSTILVHPYYQQIPLSLYFDKECFLKEDFDETRYCNEQKGKFISISNSSCCNENTTIYSKDNKYLKDIEFEYLLTFKGSTRQRNELLDYLNNIYELEQIKNFGEDSFLFKIKS